MKGPSLCGVSKERVLFLGAQHGSQCHAAGQGFFHFVPERFAVVHLLQVAQFVDDDILCNLVGQHGDSIVEKSLPVVEQEPHLVLANLTVALPGLTCSFLDHKGNRE